MKTISPRFISTATGAVIGGTLLEQDNDALGLSMGLGIGAITGYNFKVTLPDSNKMVYRDQHVIVPEGMSELDKHKTDMLSLVSNFDDYQYENLPGNLNASYDKTDIYGTLNQNNLESAIREAEDLEELRRIKIAALRPEKFSYVADPRGLPNSFVKANPKTIISGIQKDEKRLQEAVSAVTTKFRGMGYEGKDLERKVVLFKAAMADSDSVILDQQTDNIVLKREGKESVFKISSHHSEGMSAYTDTNNFYSVRSINPLAKQMVNDPDPQMSKNSIASLDGLAIAEELGLDSSDTRAVRELDNVHRDGMKIANSMGLDLKKFSPSELATLSQYLGENKKNGYQPEDLKALLYASPLYSNHKDTIDTLVDSAYQHRQEESSYRALGYGREHIVNNVANDLTKRLSGQQNFGTSFNVDYDTGMIDTDNPFKEISYKSYNGRLSEHRQFLDILRGSIQGVDDGKKADHNNIASSGKMSYISPYNFNAPMERNPYTQSRDVWTENLKGNAIGNTFERMRGLGQVPSEFNTAIVSKRISVDEKDFNLLSELYQGNSGISSLSDGGSVASRDLLGNYKTKGGRTFKVSPDKSGILELSDKVLNLMHERDALDIHSRHTGVKSSNRLLEGISRNLDKLSFLEVDELKLNGQAIPLMDAPDPKFKADDLISLSNRAYRIAEANKEFVQRNPELKNEILRPTTLEGARKKIIDDHDRGVPAKYLGYESAINNVEAALEDKDFELKKIGSKKERAETAIQHQLKALKDSVVAKIGEEGESASLSGILSAIDNFDTSKPETFSNLSDMLTRYNNAADMVFRPGEIIGINGNGTEVKFPDEFKSYRLRASSFSNVDSNSGRLQGNFVFEGSTNIGSMDTIKVYGVDHKQNMLLHGKDTYYGMLAQSMFLSEYDLVNAEMGMEYNIVESFTSSEGKLKTGTITNKDWVGKYRTEPRVKTNKKGKQYIAEDGYFFIRKRGDSDSKPIRVSQKELGKKIDSIAKHLADASKDSIAKEIGVISSIDNNGQKITALVADTLLNKDADQVISSLMAMKTVIDKSGNEISIPTKNSLSSMVSNAVNDLVIRDSRGRVTSSEAWAMGQMASALTEGKASMSSLLGMKTLGLDRVYRNIENMGPHVAHAFEFNADGSLAPRVHADTLGNIYRAAKDIDQVLGENTVINVARSISQEGEQLTPQEFKARMATQIESLFLEKANNLEKQFASAGSLGKFISEGGLDDDFANMFRYAYTDYGVSVMFASPDASQGYSTGSGKLGKSMSHIAQTQLLAAGMSKDTLGLFGSLDTSELYDYKALTTLDLDMEGQTTLNQFLDSMVYDEKGEYSKVGYAKAKSMVKRIVNSDPDDIRQILTDFGASPELINQDFIRFKLHDNKHGLTNIPLYTQNTSRNGTYISDDEKLTSKPLQKIQGELLELAFDQQYSHAGPGEDTVNTSVRKYVQTWTKTVGNMNNPMLKGTLARHAPNSSYSKVIATGSSRLGKLISLAQDVETHGVNEFTGRSFAGISRTKAAQVIQQYYGDSVKISDKSINQLVEEGVDLSDPRTKPILSVDGFIDDKTGLIRVETAEGKEVPLYTLLNREPAHSSFSISPYELMVMTDEELSKGGNIDSVYIHKDDFHYTSLMVGDFDNDHVLMYSVFKQITNNEAEQLEEYTKKIASVRNDLMPLMKSLGVKGAEEGHSGVYDVSHSINVLENNIMTYKPKGLTVEEFRNSDDYWEAVDEISNERRGNASVKGGVRKTLSAPAVKLSTYLATAVHTTPSLNEDFLTHAVAKTLNHALVENIIKTQHISTDNFPITLEAERIAQMRDDLAKGRSGVSVDEYRKSLTKFFTDMVDVAKSDSSYGQQVIDLEAKLEASNGQSFRSVIDSIVHSDVLNLKDPSRAPTSILEYARVVGAVTDEEFNARLLAEASRDMGTKIHGDNLAIIDVTDGQVNGMKSFNKGYDELLKAAKQNIIENKKPLMLGAAMLATGAILTQKNPDFQANKSIRADTQAGNMAPSMVSNMQARDTDAALQSAGRDKSEYIRPGTGMDRVRQNYSVNASYSGEDGRGTLGAKEAIFGKNITSVNINQNNTNY